MLALKQTSPRPPPKGFDHISYSAISTFQSCPLKFFFKYVLCLPVKTIASSLVFGSAMHKAVQYHFEQLLIGKPAPGLDTLLDIYQDYWESWVDQRVLFQHGRELRHAQPHGRPVAAGFSTRANLLNPTVSLSASKRAIAR